jgi:hypothetical protein
MFDFKRKKVFNNKNIQFDETLDGFFEITNNCDILKHDLKLPN